MKSHEVDYTIIGNDMQLVEVELDPGESVVAEAGVMAYMEDDISFETKMGDGSEEKKGFFGSLLSAGSRMLSGESVFLTHFTHQGRSGKRRVGFAAPYPGMIVPLQLSELGGEVLCQKGAFLCAAKGTSLGIAFTESTSAGFFGGEGFVMQKLRGDGMAFIHAGGAIIERRLTGQTLRVDTGCIVGFTPGIRYNFEVAGGLMSSMFGGEGMFLATLSGTGTVWLQSLPFSRLASQVGSLLPQLGEQG